MLLLLLKKSQVIIALTIIDLISNYFQFFPQFLTDTIFFYDVAHILAHMKYENAVMRLYKKYYMDILHKNGDWIGLTIFRF